MIRILLLISLAKGLREVRIQAPEAVRKGDNMKLFCLYDTEGDPLYIVKWYKSGKEFYRYVPRDQPSTKIFPLGNLKIQESESNATQVTLLNVDNDVTGSFSCEVSADAPSFQTAVVYGNTNVVELPDDRPLITGLKSKYKIEDIVALNCTSRNSKPAANLTWYINNKPAAKSLVRLYSNSNLSNQRISKSGIQFRITNKCFNEGRMKIRCTAHIYDIYWQSTEVSVEQEKNKLPISKETEKILDNHYHQPPPNFQLGQKKLDGQVDVKVIGSSAAFQREFVGLLVISFFIAF